MTIKRVFNDEGNLTLEEIILSIDKDISDSIIKEFFNSLEIDQNNLTIRGEK